MVTRGSPSGTKYLLGLVRIGIGVAGSSGSFGTGLGWCPSPLCLPLWSNFINGLLSLSIFILCVFLPCDLPYCFPSWRTFKMQIGPWIRRNLIYWILMMSGPAVLLVQLSLSVLMNYPSCSRPPPDTTLTKRGELRRNPTSCGRGGGACARVCASLKSTALGRQISTPLTPQQIGLCFRVCGAACNRHIIIAVSSR